MKTCDGTKGFGLANMEYVFETLVFFIVCCNDSEGFCCFSLKSQSVFSRDTRECFLFIGSLLVCLLAASATNNRIAPSKPCVCCEREMLLDKLASSPPELRARRNIMHCFLLAEKLDTMCPLSECAMATIRYVWGSPGGPARFPLLRHQALRTNGF